MDLKGIEAIRGFTFVLLTQAAPPEIEMKTPKEVQLIIWGLVVIIVSAAFPPTARADEGVEGVTAINAKVSPDYVRNKLPDGSFRPETYAFGEGGKWAGEISDATIDKLRFIDVARVIAEPLAEAKYLSASDPNKTNLLIMVYWGTTAVPGSTSNSAILENFRQKDLAMSTAKADASSKGFHGISSGNSRTGGKNGDFAEWSQAITMLNMENQLNAGIDFKNALMLGYDAPGLIGTEEGLYVRGTAFGLDRTDLVTEIEENRYFVVLMAYDFQLLWKEKKHKLLWETRFSISERRNAFDKALPVMAKYAERYFGQPSNGLLRTRVPEGRVDIGETRSLGEVEAPEK